MVIMEFYRLNLSWKKVSIYCVYDQDFATAFTVVDCDCTNVRISQQRAECYTCDNNCIARHVYIARSMPWQDVCLSCDIFV